MIKIRKRAYLTEGEIIELKNFVGNLKEYRRWKKRYDARKGGRQK